MKISNEELKQIIKEELSNVLQEMNPLLGFAAATLAKKRRSKNRGSERGTQGAPLGRPRDMEGWTPPTKPSPVKRTPYTPPEPPAPIDLDGIYSRIKAAADKTKDNTEDQAMVYRDWLYDQLDNDYAIAAELEDKGFISFDEESDRVNFER